MGVLVVLALVALLVLVALMGGGCRPSSSEPEEATPKLAVRASLRAVHYCGGVTTTVENPAPGLRERKKRATRRALQHAALHLVAEHGLEEVTVEAIAAAADVSTRTFFNYFGSKEDALAATDPVALEEILAEVAARPPSEPPLQALREVTLARAAAISADTEFWRLRSTVVRRYPELGARLVGASLAADRQVARALAERMRVDADTDPRPLLLAGVVSVAKRAAMTVWLAGDQQQDLVQILRDCFDTLATLDG